jgi:hypothetical protein
MEVDPEESVPHGSRLGPGFSVDSSRSSRPSGWVVGVFGERQAASWGEGFTLCGKNTRMRWF